MATIGDLLVRLRLNSSDYESNLRRAQRSTSNSFDAMKAAGKNMLVVGASMAAALGGAVKTAADFEQELSNAKAVSGATAEEMIKLKAAALEMGKTTSFSAAEAAGGMTELLKGGMSTADVLGGGLKAALDLAAAGELAMADAAGYVIKTMGPFSLGASQAGDVANVLAGAANASATDVAEMGLGMSQAATGAALLGFSLDDTATALGLFANKGLVGSDAGTSLKTMMARLVPQTDEATEAFKKFGLMTANGKNQFFDANGEIKSMSEVSEILKKSLGGLTAEQQQMALNTIFGSDAIRAASILTEGGAAGFDKMAAAIGKVSAAEVAAEKINNLHGSMTLLKSSVGTMAITMGDALVPSIRVVVDWVQGLIAGFNNLSEPAKKNIAIAAALTAGLALIGAPVLLLIGILPSIVAGFGLVGTALAVITGPIALVIAGLAALVVGGTLLYKNWDTIKAKAIEVWNGLKATVGGAVEGVKAYTANMAQIGKDLVLGLWQGIKDMGSWLYTNVANFVKDNLVGTVKSFLKIASPSKVMADLGAAPIEKGNEETREIAIKSVSMIRALVQNMDLQKGVVVA